MTQARRLHHKPVDPPFATIMVQPSGLPESGFVTTPAEPS
jgi:hypothetical protein